MKVFLRNTLCLFLLCSFLGANAFIPVFKHFCGDRLAKISLYSSVGCSPEEESDSCTTFKKHNCCKDEYQLLALEQELKLPNNLTIDSDLVVLGEFIGPLIHFTVANGDPYYTDNIHAPPKVVDQSRNYLHFNRLLFYG